MLAVEITRTDTEAVAMLNLGPCSMLPPHYHPRAANYVVAVQGNTTTYMFEENGARLVQETLTPGKATIFPQASMHMMVNNGMSSPPTSFFVPGRWERLLVPPI